MRIILHDYGGYPFIFQLSRALSEVGHNVIHIYSSASGSPNGVFIETKNLKVIDLGLDQKKVDKASFFRRFQQERHYGRLIEKKIAELKPEIVISANTPLEAQKRIAIICKREGIPFVHWLQDILSIAAKNVISKRSSLIGQAVGLYFKYIEKGCLNQADHVIAISRDFMEVIRGWGIPASKI
jgi:colanic acid biosynthesis glycosyl transferase WcaI